MCLRMCPCVPMCILTISRSYSNFIQEFLHRYPISFFLWFCRIHVQADVSLIKAIFLAGLTIYMCMYVYVFYSLWRFSLTIILFNYFLKLFILSKLHVFCIGEISTNLFTNTVQFSSSVVSDYLWPREPQHTRPPCLSPTPGGHQTHPPLGQWWHPTISSSVIPISSCPQSFTISGSVQMSQFFASGGQSIGVSASTSVLPMNTQDWPPLG